MLSHTINLKKIKENLQGLQANILLKHGKEYSGFFFLRFVEDSPRKVTQWLNETIRPSLLRTVDQLAILEHTSSLENTRPFVGLGLSAAAYRYLQLAPPDDPAFLRGMHKGALNDPPKSQWEKGFQQPDDLHVLLMIAADQREEITIIQEELLHAEAPVSLVHQEWGQELEGEIEHFGFVDGISQPIFIEEELAPVREKYAGKLHWEPASPLRLVLARDPYGNTENSYGSYLVFRKLSQDVKQFNANVENLAKKTGLNLDLAGAMIVGRFKDGTPLSESDKPGVGPVNNFNYLGDQAGSKCPFHAHIRKVNPRGEHDPAAETPDLENRIARRSIPYGLPGDEEVGMLFMCYQSDLRKQFELIQINWSNFGDFGRLKVGVDPLSGQGNSWEKNKPQKWPTGWGTNTFVDHHVQPCVSMRGGAYFFTPSIDSLENIAKHHEA